MRRRIVTWVGLVGLCGSGCVSTQMTSAATAKPGTTGFGSATHTYSTGFTRQATVATTVAASSPEGPDPRRDGVWRLHHGGLELEYCEGSGPSGCQAVVITDEDIDRDEGPFILLDPVNLGSTLVQTSYVNGQGGVDQLTVGTVEVGEIAQPFTPQRGVWILGPERDWLFYCSAPAGRASCSPTPLGEGDPGDPRFTALRIYATHVVRQGTEAVDVVWVYHDQEVHRCEGRATTPAPSCRSAKIM